MIWRFRFLREFLWWLWQDVSQSHDPSVVHRMGWRDAWEMARILKGRKGEGK